MHSIDRTSNIAIMPAASDFMCVLPALHDSEPTFCDDHELTNLLYRPGHNDQMVEIGILSTGQIYSLSKDLLCEASQYFRDILELHVNTAEIVKVEFGDDNGIEQARPVQVSHLRPLMRPILTPLHRQRPLLTR